MVCTFESLDAGRTQLHLSGHTAQDVLGAALGVLFLSDFVCKPLQHASCCHFATESQQVAFCDKQLIICQLELFLRILGPELILLVLGLAGKQLPCFWVGLAHQFL